MITDRYQNYVHLDMPTFDPFFLLLQRTPILLRFVHHGAKWDALDQLDDVAEPDETIIVGVRAGRSSLHIDKRDTQGRRVSEWHMTVDYVPHPHPPPDDVLRDNARWAEWCMAQPEAAGGYDPKNIDK